MRRSDNRFPAGAVSLACHTEGAGPALILLHGGMGSWTHWTRNIPALRERFTVHALDLPGCGDSFSVPEDIAADDYVGLVCADIARIAAGSKVDLAGFSFGAVVAAMVAARLPQTIRRLALLAPGGFGRVSGRPLDLRRMPPASASDIERREVLRHNLMVMMLAQPETADDATIDLQRDNVARARYDSRRFSLATYTRDAMPRIAMPAIVIYGERDNLAWPSIDARIEPCRALKPDLRIERIAEAGHWVQYEAAPQVNRLLLDFFTPVEPVASAKIGGRPGPATGS